MQQAEWDYLLTLFLLIYGSLPMNDMTRAATAGLPDDYAQPPLVMTIAALAGLAWLIWGFFTVSWWIPIVGTLAICVLWVFVTPTRFRYSSAAVRLCSWLCYLGLFNAGLTVYTRFR